MERFCLAVMVFLLLLGCSKPSPRNDTEAEKSPPAQIVIEREKADREALPSPDLKIRLKRDGKDNYSWEISGSDVDQILKANQKLKRQLGDEQRK